MNAILIIIYNIVSYIQTNSPWVFILSLVLLTSLKPKAFTLFVPTVSKTYFIVLHHIFVFIIMLFYYVLFYSITSFNLVLGRYTYKCRFFFLWENDLCFCVDNFVWCHIISCWIKMNQSSVLCFLFVCIRWEMVPPWSCPECCTPISLSTRTKTTTKKVSDLQLYRTLKLRIQLYFNDRNALLLIDPP